MLKSIFAAATRNWKSLLVGAVLFVFLSACHAVVVWQLSKYDPGSNLKYVGLIEAVTAGYVLYGLVLLWNGRLRAMAVSLLMPALLIVTELINYPNLERMSYYASIYHYGSIGGAWLLLFLCAERRWPGIRRVRCVGEFLVVLLCLALVVNRTVSGAGVTNDAVVAICQTTLKEGWHYFWHENNGAWLLALLVPGAAALGIAVVRLARSPSAGGRVWSWRLCGLLGGWLFVVFATGWAANMDKYFKPPLLQTMQAPAHYRNDVRRYMELCGQRAAGLDEAFGKLNLACDASTVPDGVYVIVIGESLDRHLMGCYDGARETTPNQSRLKKEGQAVFFNCAYASHVQTVRVVPVAVCSGNQYRPKDDGYPTELSLLDVAKKLGFKTFWFSNQERVSNAASPISVIADAADVCAFVSEEHKDSWDTELVDRLVKADLGPRALVVLHLNGNHYPYGATFPKDFAFPEGFGVYEKSVYYNDYVLGRVLDEVLPSASVVVYFSDHADAVLKGRKHDPRPEKFDREMIDVPYWIAMSEAYRQMNGELVGRLRENSRHPITNDLTFDLMLDLMGIARKDGQEYSPCSENYLLKSRPPLTFGGTIVIPDCAGIFGIMC